MLQLLNETIAWHGSNYEGYFLDNSFLAQGYIEIPYKTHATKEAKLARLGLGSHMCTKIGFHLSYTHMEVHRRHLLKTLPSLNKYIKVFPCEPFILKTIRKFIAS
jgi:hypothetical protein